MGKSLKGKELGIGISQRTDGFYMGRVTDRNGKRISKNFKKLQDCRKWVSDMQFEKEHGNVLRGDNPTVESWFDYWYEKLKKTVLEAKHAECKFNKMVKTYKASNRRYVD